jgi:hypothetical protein
LGVEDSLILIFIPMAIKAKIRKMMKEKLSSSLSSSKKEN